MKLKDEIDLILRQNETLIQTLALMGNRVESSLHMLSAIAGLTAIPMNATNLKAAASGILDVLLKELKDVEACSIMFYDSRQEVLSLLVARGQADLLEIVNGPLNYNLRFRRGQGIAGRVFAENSPLFWDKSTPVDQIEPAPAMTTPESLACLPLSIPERQLGVLNVSFSGSKPFDHPRRRAFILLSQVISNILETFILKAEVEEKAQALQQVHAQLEERINDRTSALLAVTRDLESKVTELTLAQNALVESEERYRSLVEKSLDGFFIMDFKTGRFLFLNDRLLELFGYYREEADGLNYKMGIDPNYWCEARRITRGLMSGEAANLTSQVFTARRKNGSTFRAEVAVCLITHQGKQAVLGVLRDVTEQETLRQRLEQAQRMESIGVLAGGIAHNFNNILSAIIGYTELGLIEVSRGSKVKRNLEQILTASLKARDLVRQILPISPLTLFEKKPLLIGPVIAESLKLIRATFPRTIEVRQDISSDLGAVSADPADIQQVIMNLCANAVQAMAAQGDRLSVTVRPEEITKPKSHSWPILAPGRYIHLIVSDKGPGMTPEIKSRIFEPYFTTKSKEGHTGLGLAVVYGIVKSHGGTITEESEPGQGATFHVFLPEVPSS